MFLDTWRSTIESDSHRQHLLDEAEAHRLGKIAKAARRAAQRVATPVERPPQAAPPREAASGHNYSADRRYPVSR